TNTRYLGTSRRKRLEFPHVFDEIIANSAATRRWGPAVSNRSLNFGRGAAAVEKCTKPTVLDLRVDRRRQCIGRVIFHTFHLPYVLGNPQHI
ncbi:MAG: hypothetical protein ABGZ24_06385, partial [Fuerstiella sp.]